MARLLLSSLLSLALNYCDYAHLKELEVEVEHYRFIANAFEEEHFDTAKGIQNNYLKLQEKLIHLETKSNAEIDKTLPKYVQREKELRSSLFKDVQSQISVWFTVKLMDLEQQDNEFNRILLTQLKLKISMSTLSPTPFNTDIDDFIYFKREIKRLEVLIQTNLDIVHLLRFAESLPSSEFPRADIFVALYKRLQVDCKALAQNHLRYNTDHLITKLQWHSISLYVMTKEEFLRRIVELYGKEKKFNKPLKKAIEYLKRNEDAYDVRPFLNALRLFYGTKDKK